METRADEHAEEGGGREGGRSRTPPERLLPTADPRAVPPWKKKELTKEAQAAREAGGAGGRGEAAAGAGGHRLPAPHGGSPAGSAAPTLGSSRGMWGPRAQGADGAARMGGRRDAGRGALWGPGGAQATEGGAEGGAPLMAGARVMACYGGGAAWYAGVVAAVRADGSLDIAYDDGDQEPGVPPHLVRPEGGDEDWEDLAAVVEERPAANTAPSPAAEVVEEAEGCAGTSSKSCTGYKCVERRMHLPSKVPCILHARAPLLARCRCSRTNSHAGTRHRSGGGGVLCQACCRSSPRQQRRARSRSAGSRGRGQGGRGQGRRQAGRPPSLTAGCARCTRRAPRTSKPHVVQGANGEYAQSVAQAWVRHGASQRPPATAAGGARCGQAPRSKGMSRPAHLQRSADPPPGRTRRC